jgi:hypothetical protein
VRLAAATLAAVTLASLPACKRSRLPPRADGAAVVIAPERTADGDVATVPEIEPNDTPAKAQRVVLVIDPQAASPTGGVAGAVAWPAGGKPDVDVYRLELALPDAGQAQAQVSAGADGAPRDGGAQPRPRFAIRVDARPDVGAAIKMDVADESGKSLVATAGAEPGQPFSIPNLTSAGGPTLIRVRRVAAGEAPGKYRLVFKVTALEAGAEVELDDTAATANELALPGEAIGYLGWKKDQDFYRLPTAGLAEGSVIAADLDPMPGVSAKLALLDATARTLSESHGRRGERVALRNVMVPQGATQLYLVTAADYGWNADQRYAVRVRAELAKPGAEAEPNDDVAHAQAVSDGTTVQGYLGRGDLDLYRYAAASPAVLDVEIAPPDRASLKLEIGNDAGVVLARGKPAGKGARAPLRASLPLAGGNVIIRVIAGRGEGNPDEPYRLTVTSRVAEADAGATTPAEE